MVPGSRLNNEAISTSGYAIVCPSKLEACLLVWFWAVRYFPPRLSQRPDAKDDLRYLDWLLKPTTQAGAPRTHAGRLPGRLQKTMEVSSRWL